MKAKPEQFDRVKMAEAADRKRRAPKEVPAELRKQIVQEFRELMAPAYDDHSFEAILCLKSYLHFERAKLR